MSRSYKTKGSRPVTLTLLSGGKVESESACSHFGPVRAGLIIMPDRLTIRESQDQQLSELLSTLERRAEILLLKSCEALDTFLGDTTHLVEPTTSNVETTTTNE